MVHHILRIALFAVFFSISSSAVLACGDLDLLCKQREGELNIPLPDPECRGDLCRTADGATKEARRAIDNVARELGKTPEVIQACLGNVPRCVNEILAAPVALLAQAYIDGLYRQAEGKVYPFSNEFINLAQPYYEIDLRSVTFADDINTGHGMVLAHCDRIFFTKSGNLWTDRNELHLVLHELEHLVQCQKRGRRTFLTEYLLKGAVEITKNGQFNIHDLHEFEVSAEAKANHLTNSLWASIQNGSVPVPLSTGGGQSYPVSIPVRYCSTPILTCNIVPKMVPMGTPCFCNLAGGGQAQGTSF